MDADTKDQMPEQDVRQPAVRALDGFRVLFLPETVFAAACGQRGIGFVFVAVAVVTALLSATMLFNARDVLQHLSLSFSYWPWMIIAAVYAGLIVICGAVSFVLHFGYTRLLRVSRKKQEVFFYQDFLCRFYLMPWWAAAVLLCAGSAALPAIGWWHIVAVVLLLRLVALETCLLRVVYGAGLQRSYAVIFGQVVVFAAGMLLGAGFLHVLRLVR